ncbi:MAG TPA: hypothetical protein VEA69_04985 [Tepidisphaeraceae bacterium]|nr:hypothetical protein [Tepidisphaeraceae bacterium]
MSNRTPLSVVRVEKPCLADWDQMSGEGAVRFCQHCQKHVHDLSAMPAGAAERLVCLSADKMCVRYAAGADGQPLTLEYLRQTPPRWRWRVWTTVAVSLALISGSVQALFFGKRVAVVPAAPPPPPTVRMVMGKIGPAAPCPTPVLGTAAPSPQ